MKKKKDPQSWPWRPDLLLTPTRGRVGAWRGPAPAGIGRMRHLIPYFHRPQRAPHLFPPFGLN